MNSSGEACIRSATNLEERRWKEQRSKRPRMCDLLLDLDVVGWKTSSSMKWKVKFQVSIHIAAKMDDK